MHMDNEYFTVIVGDLVNSRLVEDRNRFQKEVNTTLVSINSEFKNELYAPLKQTLGIDEISGVLKNPAASYRICRMLNYAINPLQFRFAIVSDTLDVSIDSYDAGKMDGAAFHIASNLLGKRTRSKGIYHFQISGDSSINSILNNLTELIQILRSDWTDHQRRIFDLYMKHRKQRAVGDILNITQQAVSEALKKTHWREINAAEDSIDKILNKL